MSEPQTERNLQYLLAEQVKKSDRMKMDIAFYMRDEYVEGTCFCNKYLMDRLRATVEYTREKERRQEQIAGVARMGGSQIAALAAKAKAKSKPNAKAKSTAQTATSKGKDKE